MIVLVTGAKGLLGSAIRRVSGEYPQHGFVFSSDLDLRDGANCRRLLEEHRPECVIHCAAKVGGYEKNRTSPEELFYDNVVMAAQLFHAAAQAGVKHLVGFGSNCMYGEVEELRTDNIHVGEPFANNRAYGFAKRMIDVHLDAVGMQYGIQTHYIVPVSMYGPEDNFHLHDAHVIPALIHKCYLARDSLAVWGDGEAVREVVFSEDVARIVLGRLGQPSSKLVIGSGQHVSIRTMVETIGEALGFRGRIVWQTDKPSGQKRRPPAQPFPYPYTPFPEGIRRTCQWFRDHYPHVRK